MTLLDCGPLTGACMFLAQIGDPVSTAGGVFERYGWPGLMALGIVAMYFDGRRREDKAQASAEKREAEANERLKDLNSTLGDLKLLIGRLLEKHGGRD